MSTLSQKTKEVRRRHLGARATLATISKGSQNDLRRGRCSIRLKASLPKPAGEGNGTQIVDGAMRWGVL